MTFLNIYKIKSTTQTLLLRLDPHKFHFRNRNKLKAMGCKFPKLDVEATNKEKTTRKWIQMASI